MSPFLQRSLLTIAVLVAWPAVSRAAIAVDSNNYFNCNGAVGSLACTTVTYSLTVGAGGANRLLVVGTVINVSKFIGGLTGQTVSSVTYNGESLTQIGTHLNSDDEDREDQWYLINPPVGANNVVVTVSAPVDTILSGATSLTGASQFTPIRGNAAADNKSNTASVTVPSQLGDLVLDTVCTGTDINSTSETQQYIYNIDSTDACNNIGGSTAAGTSSVVMSWSVHNDFWTDFASSIEPAGTPYVIHMGGGHIGKAQFGF